MLRKWTQNETQFLKYDLESSLVSSSSHMSQNGIDAGRTLVPIPNRRECPRCGIIPATMSAIRALVPHPLKPVAFSLELYGCRHCDFSPGAYIETRSGRNNSQFMTTTNLPVEHLILSRFPFFWFLLDYHPYDSRALGVQ